MFDQLVDFSATLRTAGVPVSMTEVIDASRALSNIGDIDRSTFKVALFSTMVKDNSHRAVFDLLFDLFFANKSYFGQGSELNSEVAQHQFEGSEAGGESGTSSDDLREWLIGALVERNLIQVSRLARAAVARFAGMERGRAVSGVYYIYRTLKQLDIELIYARLSEEMASEIAPDALGQMVLSNQVDQIIASLRSAIEVEVRRLLVEDRGELAVAKTMRPTLPEDIDFMQATRDELAKVSQAVTPLSRKLASRLARRRRIGHRGSLDFRRTFRRSLGHGGVPVDLKFHAPKLAKPEIFVIADISGSVSSFARFALQLVYALSEQFSRVRSFVFVDAIDEVTRFFEASSTIEEALRLINTQANVVHIDGHTDYGNCFEQFAELYLASVTKKSTVLILGDARNNYHASRSDILAKIQDRARHLYWLNPEPTQYWNSGDSIIREYAKYCHGVVECRNLRQLEKFVDFLG